MVSLSGHRWVVGAAFATLFSVLVSSPAAAQSSIRFIGGGSIDPEQIFAGVAWQSPDIGGRFRIQPGIDGGWGDGLRLATINIDLVVKFPLGTSGWSLIQGGGPVISVAKYTGEFEDLDAELHAGGSYLFGFEKDNGFFAEFRVGGGDFVPQLKMGVGWSVKLQ